MVKRKKKKKKATKKAMKPKGLHLDILPVFQGNGRQERYTATQLDSVEDWEDRFNFNGSWAESGDDAKNDYNDEYYLLVLDGKDVGCLKISKSQIQRKAGIAFYLKKEARAMGVLTKCKDFIGERVFRQLGFHRIEATCFATNTAAMVAYPKWMREEGREREAYYHGGFYVDRVRFGVLKRESAWA